MHHSIRSSSTTSRRGRLLSVLAALMVTAAFCACSDESTSDESSRNADGGITTGGKVGVFRLRVGDCIEDLSGEVSEVTAVAAVPCDEPHVGEVIAKFDLDANAWPGTETVAQQATEGCLDRFEDYVGTAQWESWFTIQTFEPTEESWESADDRSVVCIGTLEGIEQSQSMDGVGAGPDKENIIDTGDCFVAEEAVDLSPEVRCDAPHDGEVIAVFELPAGAWPGADEAKRAADAGCVERFAAYVGIAYGDSEFEVNSVPPLELTWDRSGGRNAFCLAQLPGEPMSESMQGARR
jgi:hypothetical protein